MRTAPSSAVVAIAAIAALAAVWAIPGRPARADTPDPGTAAAAAAAAAGTASLPLAELLRLHRELDRARQERPGRQPIAAILEKLEISGLLLDYAAELTAHVEAQVFAPDGATLPLLQRDAWLHVLSFPRLDDATLAVTGGMLSLVATRPGTYDFDVALRAQARHDGTRRQVRLAPGASTAASLKLKYDPGLFRLQARHAAAQPDGATLFPEEGLFAFAWEPTPQAAVRARAQEAQPRPAVEAVVERARASVVSTLAGKRIVRVLFELKLEGSRAISVTVPEGYAVERVFVNGAARDVPVSGGGLSLEVRPERSGDARGRLELLLAEQPGRFKLSGDLRFALPSASWRTDQYLAELHLPEVFNYRWRGGSLSPCQAEPEPAEFSSPLPTPGRRMCLQQALVFEPPTAEVGYHVDLTGRYWTGTPGPPSPAATP